MFSVTLRLQVVTLSLKPMPAAFKRRSSVTRMSVGDRSHLKDLSAERISEHHSATATELRVRILLYEINLQVSTFLL